MCAHCARAVGPRFNPVPGFGSIGGGGGDGSEVSGGGKGGEASAFIDVTPLGDGGVLKGPPSAAEDGEGGGAVDEEDPKRRGRRRAEEAAASAGSSGENDDEQLGDALDGVPQYAVEGCPCHIQVRHRFRSDHMANAILPNPPTQPIRRRPIQPSISQLDSTCQTYPIRLVREPPPRRRQQPGPW